MRLLLDTHVMLWLAVSPAKLSEATLERVRDARQDLLMSTVSAWEISIKYANGKLPLASAPAEFVPELQRRLKLSVLPIELTHAIRAGALPPLHRDPFDRMLVAQAMTHGLPIVTVDPRIAAYGVEVIRG
ncbi:MAG: type II toxin-antitoxin system VapC family toxin [Microlunatus sp.]|nr:type II toxin-antitoxin system VapC family toxin [Microlunatus sp.]MDN5769957.1 type II toxin-antitoxin system VapC family toxin [Microlunatus sp.]MDN5803692.1 type II toxin-antitoxin system VapC family toxin [Microlunatus sp.]